MLWLAPRCPREENLLLPEGHSCPAWAGKLGRGTALGCPRVTAARPLPDAAAWREKLISLPRARARGAAGGPVGHKVDDALGRRVQLQARAGEVGKQLGARPARRA